MQTMTPKTQLLFHSHVPDPLFVSCNADSEQVTLASFQLILEHSGTTHPNTLQPSHIHFKAKMTYGWVFMNLLPVSFKVIFNVAVLLQG
jgi:hypothetical protein